MHLYALPSTILGAPGIEVTDVFTFVPVTWFHPGIKLNIPPGGAAVAGAPTVPGGDPVVEPAPVVPGTAGFPLAVDAEAHAELPAAVADPHAPLAESAIPAPEEPTELHKSDGDGKLTGGVATPPTAVGSTFALPLLTDSDTADQTTKPITINAISANIIITLSTIFSATQNPTSGA